MGDDGVAVRSDDVPHLVSLATADDCELDCLVGVSARNPATVARVVTG